MKKSILRYLIPFRKLKEWVSFFILIVIISGSFIGYVQDFPSTRQISLLGQASWYSESDPGVLKNTANMEVFNDQEYTCAMWDIPFNTHAQIINLETGKSVFVRVNDRGPAKRLVKNGRIIDLSKKAFSEIADLKRGLIRVQVILYPGLP